MAKTEIGASVNVEFQSIGKMRKAIKEATSDLIIMQEQFGKSSPQAIEAAKRIAEMKDRIQDAKEQADLFDPGNKFKALSNAASQLAGGFAAVQGAMALAGTESEDLQKTLVKVQGALALSQGLSQIADLGKAFGELKVFAVDAFSTMRKAMMSIGIGLLVTALGLIIANFDEFKKAVFRLIPGLETMTKFIGGLVQGFTDFIGITSEAERNLDKLIKTNKRANETIDDQIKLLEAQGGKEDEIYRLKKQRSENELNTLRESLKVKGKLSEEELKQFRDLKTGQQILDIEESNRIKKQNEDRAKEQQEAAKKAAADRKAAAEKAAKEAEDARKMAAERAAAADKVIDDARRAKLTEQQRAEEDVLRAFEERKKTLAAAGITDTKAIEEQREMELAAIRQKYADAEAERLKKIEDDKIKKEQDLFIKKSDQLLKEAENEQLSFEERFAKVAEREALMSQMKFASEEERTAFEKANADARVQIAQDEASAKIALTQEIGNALGALSDVVGRETAAGKALAIAQATINTFLGITEVWKAKSVLPEPLNTASKIAATVTTAAGGFAAVRNIVKTQVPGRGGGGAAPAPSLGGAAPVAATPSPTVTATAVNTQAVNNLGNQAMRAYVLNSDISNNDQRNAYLQRNARLG